MAKNTTARVTPAQYKEIKELATTLSGYDSSSQIWGQTLAVVLESVADLLANAKFSLSVGEYDAATVAVKEVGILVTQLQARENRQTIINAKLHSN